MDNKNFGQKILFCPYCGTKLDEDAKFCKNCGEAISNDAQESHKILNKRPSSENPTERKNVYEGYIHKCPNCGEVMDSFLTVCPACRYEIRDVRSSFSVSELVMKLENISAQKMPAFEEKKSVMKMVFGKDFKEENEAEEAMKRFESQKEQEKASLIINFSVPNSREDIMEFMILAASNIDVKKSVDDVVTKAWISKLDQVYQKAEISMRGHPNFLQIKEIYDRKKKELKNKKIKGFLIGAGCVAGWFFLLGLLWNPAVTIALVVGVLIMAIIGVVLFKKK